MIVGGDFNAANVDWGYAKTSPRGRQLADAYERANLLMVNDPNVKTRYGTNRRSGDTTPDLTLVTPRARATWNLSDDPWGSDHYPIRLELMGVKRTREKRITRTTLWDKFRESEKVMELAESTDTFTAAMVQATKAATVEKLVDMDTPTPDTRLLSLWNQRSIALDKYRRTKDPEQLAQVNNLTKEAKDHARNLSTENWFALCESFNEHTSLSKAWAVCNAMFGKKKTTHTIQNMALGLDKTIEEIAEEIGPIYFPQPTVTPEAEVYEREEVDPTDPINADFTEWEMEAAITKGRTKSTPGPDLVSGSMQSAGGSANSAVKTHQRPEWKLSWVSPIPKAGKASNVPENTRPISLTSVLCKVMERMVLARLDWITEEKGTYHPAQTGFRKHLGTHDSLELIRQGVTQLPAAHYQVRIMVAVDVKKANDSNEVEGLRAINRGSGLHSKVTPIRRPSNTT
ncbi:hypothetical protein HPB47_020385 [Ixodes persulcatus]|uniref:Uncharacterized protein n=1 Tax=Ixodes persulcatus TaxID=34615 RepID=A0AC60QIX0_IXOPE|nr:hypothetical protein HPB47_020385 [Ixodes persulcatus]